MSQTPTTTTKTHTRTHTHTHTHFTLGETPVPEDNTNPILELTPIPSRDAFQTIEILTERFHKKYDISEQFIQQLQTRLNSDEIIYEGSIVCPVKESDCHKICGKNRAYFTQTANQQNIAMIWHDKTANPPLFRFWGDKTRIAVAMNVIKYRIENLE
tara:strand:+ start:4505 stop:4975 length:471 start_codon:yes stop_codon:yes gene_type:complete